MLPRLERQPLVVPAGVLDEHDEEARHAVVPVVRGKRGELRHVAVAERPLRRDVVEVGEVANVAGEHEHLLGRGEPHLGERVEVVGEDVEAADLHPQQRQHAVGVRLAPHAEAEVERAAGIHLARREGHGIGEQQVVVEVLQFAGLEGKERRAEHGLVHGAIEERVAREPLDLPAGPELGLGHGVRDVLHEVEDVVLRGPRRVAVLAVIEVAQRAPGLLDERRELTQRRGRGLLEGLEVGLRERVGAGVVGEAGRVDGVGRDVFLGGEVAARRRGSHKVQKRAVELPVGEPAGHEPARRHAEPLGLERKTLVDPGGERFDLAVGELRRVGGWHRA